MGLWGLSTKQKCNKHLAMLSVYKHTHEWVWNICEAFTSDTAAKNRAPTGPPLYNGKMNVESHDSLEPHMHCCSTWCFSEVAWCFRNVGMGHPILGHPQEMTAHFCFSSWCVTSKQGGILRPPPESGIFNSYIYEKRFCPFLSSSITNESLLLLKVRVLIKSCTKARRLTLVV